MKTIYLPDVRGGPDRDKEQELAIRTQAARDELARLITTADWQLRPSMAAHDILMQVAQARAEFISKLPADVKGAAGHTFPGVPGGEQGPNEWLRDAGYLPPEWYGIGNSVESYSTGFRDNQAAIEGWLNSPPHRAHITGAGSFYGAQLNYGIGVVFTGRWNPARVVITCH